MKKIIEKDNNSSESESFKKSNISEIFRRKRTLLLY